MNQAKLGDLGHSKHVNTISELSCIAGTFCYMGLILILLLNKYKYCNIKQSFLSTRINTRD